MTAFKCKLCGGTFELDESQTTATCAYCGTLQTIPRLDDERRANLYDRAGHFRRNNEFDKAMSIYETILNDDIADAEAYWSLVLCRYGIEYVEDPATRKRLPTVNRTRFTSVFDDEDYKSALRHADMAQKSLYEAEARVINEIQKSILSISRQEEPFDVFICYKETDAGGRRTPDSVLAQELYYQLKNEGFQVFFSRISLEDKLGSAYEPYIFAALNSAKVMVALGTRREHFDSPWVKNEWSRYLALVKQSEGKKVLIPAYRDMDPYELPEEFSHLQAQDMAKLGFMQDLIRGIKKLVAGTEPKPVVRETVIREAAPVAAVNVTSLLDRAFIFLEDGDFARADDFCEQVLNRDSRNAEAYLAQLMVQLKIQKREQLGEYPKPLEESGYFDKILRFGSDALKAELIAANDRILNRIEEARRDTIYDEACQAELAADEYASALDPEAVTVHYPRVIEMFRSISGHKNADFRAELCTRKMQNTEAARIYGEAERLEESASVSNSQDPEDYRVRANALEEAMAAYASVSQWRDAAERRRICTDKLKQLLLDYESAIKALEEARIKAAKRKKTARRVWLIIAGAMALLLAGVIVFFAVIKPAMAEKELRRTYGADAIIATRKDMPYLSKNQVWVADMNAVPSHVDIPHMYEGEVVTVIPSTAFQYCDDLISVTIPNSVTRIGTEAFAQCEDLETVLLPDSVTDIGYEAFADCSSLTSLTIPDSVTSIGEAAFSGCSSLTSITIPDSVTSIGNRTFADCSSLTSITIPGSVRDIGHKAFYGCDGLTSLTVADGVLTIDSDAFSHCDSLTSVVLADSVTNISNAFNGCKSLTSVTLSKGLTSLQSYAFSNCTSLVDITIPDNVTELRNGVFNHCTSLVGVTMPATVTNIGSYVFSGCNSLEIIRFGGTTEQWKEIHKSRQWKDVTTTVTVRCTDGDIIE